MKTSGYMHVEGIEIPKFETTVSVPEPDCIEREKRNMEDQFDDYEKGKIKKIHKPNTGHVIGTYRYNTKRGRK